MHENTVFTCFNPQYNTKTIQNTCKYKKIQYKIQYNTCIFYIIIYFTLGCSKKKTYTSLSYAATAGSSAYSETAATAHAPPGPT